MRLGRLQAERAARPKGEVTAEMQAAAKRQKGIKAGWLADPTCAEVRSRPASLVTLASFQPRSSASIIATTFIIAMTSWNVSWPPSSCMIHCHNHVSCRVNDDISI